MAENRRETTISNPLPTPHMQELAASMTTVAGNAKQIDLLILGGGRGGMAMLEVLQHYDWVNIHAIVDITEQALAFPAARETGIATFTDRDKAFQQFHGDIVIDVTGDKNMPKLLAPSLRLRQIELISGKSAKMLFDLIHEQLRKDKTIDSQNTRMNLLDSMLEITMQLENRPPLADIINKAMADLCRHVRAPHALAAVFHRKGSGSLVRTVGVEKPDCELSDCIAIQAICAELNEHHRFKILAQPIKLHCSATDIRFNVVLPLRGRNSMVAAMLLDVPGAVTREQRTTLNMTSIHLNMAIKTLQQYEQLEQMAIYDGLTGVYNRHYFKQKLKKEVSRARRSQHSTLTCAFIDIDDFKQVNDGYGHQVGDMVITEIAQAILKSVRDYDTCARYGGDEFVLLMPDSASDADFHMEKIGMRILEYVDTLHIPEAPELSVGVSIGMARKSAETLVDGKKLLAMADHAVYQAKEAGKNCMRICSDEQFHLNPDSA